MTAGIVVVLAGCGSKELTEAPERGGGAEPPPGPESTVGAKIGITYARLAAEANKAAPTNYSTAGRAKPCVKVLGVEICQDVDYSVDVTRDGPITVARGPTPETARIAVPVKFSGWGGLTGEIAKVLKLDKKNFDGSFVGYVDAGLDVGADWCPKITATTGFDWRDKARIEVMHKWNFDVSGELGPEMQKQIDKMRDQLVGAIDCAKVKAEVAKLFMAQTFPIALPDNGNVYVNVEPVSLGFSGVEATDSALELALLVTAKIAVATAAAATGPKPLPELKRVPLTAGKISLAVPLRASYDRLNAAIAPAVKDKSFATDAPAGKITVKVQEAEVYPSKDKVAVRVKFVAETPGSWFDTKGTAYLAAKPVVENDGTVIALTDLQFSRVLDSAAWNAVSAVFEKDIRAAIGKAARVDLAGPIAQAKAALATQLAELQKKTGVQVVLSDTTLAAGPIVPTATELVAQVRVETVANVVIGETP